MKFDYNKQRIECQVSAQRGVFLDVIQLTEAECTRFMVSRLCIFLLTRASLLHESCSCQPQINAQLTKD